MTDTVTSYDEHHFLTYARLLDAETAGTSWDKAAARILGCDIGRDAEAARRCWDSHLARARWIAAAGYVQLLHEAGFDPDMGASDLDASR
ncbi:MAG TPA: DUF2285 domain-containing protein [Sphingomonas sp.]|nr:DUF2285 domain-containing protein [Sphingomonas sp.]